MVRTINTQMEAMISFMEEHADLSRIPSDPYQRFESEKRWLELASMLNKIPGGEAKSVAKWRKVWSDWKNNTKKKVKKLIMSNRTLDITLLETRGLKVMENAKKLAKARDERPQIEIINMETQSELSNAITISPPIEEGISEEYQYQIISEEIPERRRSTSSLECFESSISDTKKECHENDEVKEITEKFLEYEKEKSRMAHEQKMARIKQNDNFMLLLNRMVNVLETITPKIQTLSESEANNKR